MTASASISDSPDTPDAASRHESGNVEFLKSLGMALLALLVSAAVLIVGYAASSSLTHQGQSETSSSPKQRVLYGEDLIPRLGSSTEKVGKSRQITKLHDGEDQRAILTRYISFNAADYPFLGYSITKHHPMTSVYLIWRTADDPDTVSNMRLHWNEDKPASARLALHEKWQGRITEVGLDIYGDLRGQPIVIDSLTLLPSSAGALLTTTWSEWRAFRGWTQKSAHQLPGVPEGAMLSPTLAMATWAGLSLGILFLINLMTRLNYWPAYLIAIFIPWLALDQLWQSKLSAQLEETKYLFAGKTQQQKHLADWESELYQYTQHLTNNVLPQPGPRIHLLNDASHRTYKRLRAQYYLLPHNIYNYDRFPKKNATQPGDYILVLGEIEGLKFSDRTDTLNWSNHALPVKQIDNQPLGTLYQVVAPVPDV